MAPKHAPFLAILLACGLQLAASCSDVGLAFKPYDAIISARDYDFFAQKVLTMQFSIMPARTNVLYTPLLGCDSPGGLSADQTQRSKYGFICATVGRPEFVAGFWAGCGSRDYDNFPGQCTEGFNTQGLSVGALTDQSQPFPPTANASPGQKPGIYFNDVPAFLLANYKSIADIRDNFTPDKYRVVNNPAFYDVLFKLSPIAATRIDHFALHDATGASGVIEFSNATNGNFVWNVIETEGVLTNSPGYALQTAYSNEFQQQQNATYGVNGLIMTPGFCGVGWNVTTWENNNCNSMGRFTVLSMLKKNVANTPFPDPTYMESPASNPDPAHKAIIMALRMLDWVKVPGHWPNLGAPGPSPANQIIGAEEMTICQFVKNHRRLIWYVKTAANEQWARFDLKKIFRVPSLETGRAESYDDDDFEARGSYYHGGNDRDGPHSPYGDNNRDGRGAYGGNDRDGPHSPYGDYDRDGHGSYGYGDDSRDHRGHGSHGSGSTPPVTRPIHHGVGNIMPPTRRWATDKTDEVMRRW